MVESDKKWPDNTQTGINVERNCRINMLALKAERTYLMQPDRKGRREHVSIFERYRPADALPWKCSPSWNSSPSLIDSSASVR